MTVFSERIAEWRTDRWWLEDEYVCQYEQAISPEQVDRCVAAVLRVFDDKWVDSDLIHAAYYEIFSRGSLPLKAIIDLGKNLLAVERCAGFRDILEALRNPGDYKSTKLELAVAAMYCEAGYEIELRPTTFNSKKADLLVRIDGQEVLFEIKILRRSDESNAVDAFTTRLGSILEELTRNNSGTATSAIHYQVNLDPAIGKVCIKQMGQSRNSAQEFLERIKDFIAHQITSGITNFNIPQIGHFTFGPKERLPESFISTPIDPQRELRRIMGSRLRSAMQQLRSDRPGVVVFHTDGILEEASSNAIVQEFLRTQGDKASHVSAIVFLPTFYVLPHRWSQFKRFAVVNPLAEFPALSLRAFQIFVDQCGLVIFEGQHL